MTFSLENEITKMFQALDSKEIITLMIVYISNDSFYQISFNLLLSKYAKSSYSDMFNEFDFISKNRVINVSCNLDFYKTIIIRLEFSTQKKGNLLYD